MVLLHALVLYVFIVLLNPSIVMLSILLQQYQIESQKSGVNGMESCDLIRILIIHRVM